MFNDRYYTIDGIKYPSVTTVLKVHANEALTNWKAKLGYEAAELMSEQTADLGKEVHHLVAQLLLKKPITGLEWSLLDEEIKRSLRAFVRFQQDTKLESIEVEKLVYSKRFKYAGTLDFFGRIGNGLAISDWKTGERCYPSYVAQTVAYHMAFVELNPMVNIERLLIVNLPRTTGIPKITIIPVWGDVYKAYRKYFLACLNLFKMVEEIDRFKIPSSVPSYGFEYDEYYNDLENKLQGDLTEAKIKSREWQESRLDGIKIEEV
jgi:hypothetical protein